MLVATEDGCELVPGLRVPVVCGLGAGDAFGGALCHGLLAGWPPAECVRFANAAGAIVASRLLCADAMPAEDEVRALLTEAIGEAPPARRQRCCRRRPTPRDPRERRLAALRAAGRAARARRRARTRERSGGARRAAAVRRRLHRRGSRQALRACRARERIRAHQRLGLRADRRRGAHLLAGGCELALASARATRRFDPSYVEAGDVPGRAARGRVRRPGSSRTSWSPMSSTEPTS